MEEQEITKTDTPATQDNNTKSPALGFGAGLGIGLTIGAIALFITIGINAFNDYKAIKAANETVLDAATTSKIKSIEQAIDTYYFNYNENENDLKSMREGLYQGIIASLDDPYSTYYSAEEYTKLKADNQGVYYGIGAYISIDETNYPILSSIMENTPAEAAGLMAEDIIYKIDGESTYGLTLEEVVSRVKGEEGTYVHLTIYREGETDYLEFDVMRAAVESPSVDYEMLEDNIAYIQIEEFDTATINQFANAYTELLEQGATGLIIDLRSNGGGLLNSCLGICRQILPEGLIVYTENKDGNRKEYYSDGLSAIEIPLVVLVNRYSASASEIMAGAIKDNNVGTIVGETTFGKGIVQDVHQFSDGSAVKLTERAYYTPAGNYIQGTGIDPDVEVEFDVAKYYEDGSDSQLNKAIEIVKGEK